MTGLMASLGLDARNFNQNAQQVIAKTEQIKNKVAAAGTSKRIDFSRGTGLAADPAVMFAEQKVLSSKDKLRAAEKAAALREIADAKRLGQAAAEAKAQGAKAARNNKSFMAEAMREEAAAAGVGAKNMSALGGAAKMFAGFLTVDFIRQQTSAMIEYASMLTAMGGRLNADTAELDAWDKALKGSGTTLKEIEPILDKFNKNRVAALKGNAKQSDAAAVLGLSVDQLKSMGTTDLVMQAGKALESGQNREAVIAAFQTMGGDGATALVEAMQGGLAQSVQSVKDSGDHMSAQTIAILKSVGDRFADMFATISTGFGGLAAKIGQAAANIAESLMLPIQILSRFVGGFSGGEGFTGGIKEGLASVGDLWKEQKEKQDERDKKIADAGTAFQAAPVNVDVENKNEPREQAALDKQVKREMERAMSENAKLGKHSVNSMQQAGAFLGNAGIAASPEIAMLNATTRSEEHLRQILEIAKKKKQGGDSSENETIF